MPNIGPVELIIILVIALIVIGPGRLPDVGAALGKSIREFRKASSDIADITRVDGQPATPSSAAAPAPPAAPPASNAPSEAPAVPPSAAPAPTPELVQPAPATPTSPSPVAVPHVDDDAGRPA